MPTGKLNDSHVNSATSLQENSSPETRQTNFRIKKSISGKRFSEKGHAGTRTFLKQNNESGGETSGYNSGITSFEQTLSYYKSGGGIAGGGIGTSLVTESPIATSGKHSGLEPLNSLTRGRSAKKKGAKATTINKVSRVYGGAI